MNSTQLLWKSIVKQRSGMRNGSGRSHSQFAASVEDAIARIVDAPRRWRVVDEDVRRCLTRVFPFGILYTIESDFLLIVAIMHFSREPDYWKSRIRNR